MPPPAWAALSGAKTDADPANAKADAAKETKAAKKAAKAEAKAAGASGAEPAPTRRRATDVHYGTSSPAVGVRDGTPVDPDGLDQVQGQVGGAITHTSSCCTSL